MKIEKITLKNITSFKGEVSVDFTEEPLRSSGLFAITGETGAGKSTILDAVCLALYGKAPRFDELKTVNSDYLNLGPDGEQSIQPNDARMLLRRGEKEGFVRVVFTASDASRWEAEWSVRRKRTGTYDKATQTLRCLFPNKYSITDTKEAKETIPQVVGLDYGQFTRTVMLAQNSFASFLRAKDEDKSALLEKLTGTEIYAQISRNIHEKARAAKDHVGKIQMQLDEAMRGVIPEEELQRCREEFQLTETRINHNTEQKNRAAAQLKWYEENERAESRLRELEREHDLAGKECAAQRNEEKLLQLYDSVIEIRPVYQNIQTRRQDIDAANAKEVELKREHETQRKQFDEAKNLCVLREERLKEMRQILEEKRPDIERGKVLLAKISTAEKHLESSIRQQQQMTGIREKHEANLADSTRELQLTERKIEEAKERRQKMANHRTMFDEFGVVKTKLTQLEDTADLDVATRKLLEENRQKESQAKEAAQQLKERLDAQEGKYTSLHHTLMLERKNVEGIDGILLQSRLNDIVRRKVLLSSAKSVWENLSQLYEALALLDATVRSRTAEIGRQEQELERARIVFETRTEEYESKRVAHTLSQSSDIKALRQNLKEGTPCPVCGSAHHPYHSETELELGQLIQDIGKEHEAAKKRLQASEEQVRRLEQSLLLLKSELSTAQKQLEEGNLSRGRYEAEWEEKYASLDNSFRECSPSINGTARQMMILTLEDSASKEEKEIRQQLDDFNKHQTAIQRLTEEEAQVKDVRDDLTAKYNQQIADQRVAHAQIRTLTETRKNNDKMFSQTYQDLDKVVTVSNWFTEWSRDHDAFGNYVTELYNEWTANETNVSRGEERLATLREQVRGIRQQVEDARQNEAEATENCAQERKELQGLRQDYQILFPDQSPDVVQGKLESQVVQSENDYKFSSTELETISQRLYKLDGQIEKLSGSRAEAQKNLNEETEKLYSWISSYNGRHETLAPHQLDEIFSTNRDWNALRQFINGLYVKLNNSKAHLEAAQQLQQELQRHPDRPSGSEDETKTALQDLLERSGALLVQLEESRSNLKLRLRAHDESSLRVGDITQALQAAQADAEQWSSLNSIFGSADGKKFRSLAQHYTFNSLVVQANYQLQQLSPRYELHTIPGTLALEITDRDMFDQKRYVSSLSGGETFVVSLALALGLATISSQNLTIGSLFIDEGFGNLDAASLDLVMSALGNLENAQGRKVGIISHTDQIRSQISPQIHVAKHAGSGRSTIEIL